MIKQHKHNVFILLTAIVGFSLASCGMFKPKSAAQKAQEAQKEKEWAEKQKQAKLQQKAIDYHMSLQSKEVRKRMKRSRKMSTTPFSSEKGMPFYKRWFSKKRYG